ncbi:Gfo/Idh/MocA family protein [Hoeflea poritis]|uniref:Gfo/Idh/MocA family oxidoreductase n=1 Tax=Hoeflea poritis TaxID=2993659 RepID=A0ABT4VJU3_9HYPH|nr:Gfo/Idh/MocA family oxidoreductase [Hoeflea poritis]MDA4844978.1 Gfo/Idh/MocA family oxidoreductase [Hoeflea poritis]
MSTSQPFNPGDFGAAVIGTGFIGTVHAEALRRLGVKVTGLLGSSPERAAERARQIGVEKAYESLDQLLDDPAVNVVHVTSPNRFHFEQVKQILAAGRHVVCEKPLAVSSQESAELVKLAADSGLIAAVNYNIRFYPLNQHAHRMVRDGGLGEIRLISGHYLQDWLLHDTDWNWRLDPKEGGALRAVGDIGTHWIDLTNFISGQKVTSVFAELSTFIKTRQQPVGPVETFSQGGGGETVERQIETDDTALILLRYANGARGSLTVSQVSAGRKNSLQWEIDGSQSAASWHSETPDHLWIGHRGKPNEILQRDASLMNATGAAAAGLPGGHVEGFADTFYALYRNVYGAVAAGGPPDEPLYATFEDGHEEMLICDAVLRSAKEGCWVEIGS